MSPVTAPTIGILLVGNELLSGKVRDENAYFLARELNSLGLDLRRVVLVPDERDDVIEGVLDLLERVDLVFTSGGIGPTHDDITVEAVAQALDRELELVPELADRARTIFGQDIGPAHLKMAHVPRGSELIESEQLRWPVIRTERVFVLAGVPEILRRGFDALRPHLPSGDPQYLASVYLTTDEWSLAPLLQATLESYPDVEVGSYPVFSNPDYRVRVTFEALDPHLVRDAQRDLVERLSPDHVVRVEEPRLT